MSQLKRHAKPADSPPPSMSDALIRLSDVLAPRGPIPVSRATWWDGVRQGRYPQPVKLGSRITAWRRSQIIALVEQGVAS